MERNFSDRLERSLNDAQLEMLHLLAYQASILQMPIYLVGGVVRDIFLNRSIKDLDLVLEGDATRFVNYLVKKMGGRSLTHSKFKTATWNVTESTLKRLDFPAAQLSGLNLSFDLTSARSETYAHPGALPTIKMSSIGDDLRRRDFTVNALAVRLDGDHFGELVDVTGGRSDLERGVIRVLHPKSFVDDPTRMFRAVRYAGRYEFKISPDTMPLFNAEAKSIMAELSGERLRHELDLIFDEVKPSPMLAKLRELSLLSIIHPALSSVDHKVLSHVVDNPADEFGEFAVADILSFKQSLSWILCLMDLSAKDIEEIAERMSFPALLTKAALAAFALSDELPLYKKQSTSPSQWTFRLDELPALSVYAVWLVSSVQPLHDYLVKWRDIHPFTTGEDLKEQGLAPGPRYKEILSHLRASWLDGEVQTKDEEIKLRNKLIAN